MDKPSGQVRQGRLFNPERYSPVTVGVWIRLPASSARAFAIASSLGKIIRRDSPDSPFLSIRSYKEAAGVFIGPKQRTGIKGVLDIESRQWRRLTTEWVKLYVAHRCARQIICLFVRPLEEVCPYCNAEIPLEPSGHDPTPKGTNSDRIRGGLRPLFVPEGGDAPRDERGDGPVGSRGSRSCALWFERARAAAV